MHTTAFAVSHDHWVWQSSKRLMKAFIMLWFFVFVVLLFKIFGWVHLLLRGHSAVFRIVLLIQVIYWLLYSVQIQSTIGDERVKWRRDLVWEEKSLYSICEITKTRYRQITIKNWASSFTKVRNQQQKLMLVLRTF